MYVAPALGAFHVHVGTQKGCFSHLVNQGVVWVSQYILTTQVSGCNYYGGGLEMLE